MRSLRVILASAAVLLIAATLPVVGFAAPPNVQIHVMDINNMDHNCSELASPVSDTVTQFSGNCIVGADEIVSFDPLGDNPEVVAETSGSTDQLILRNAVITNNSSGQVTVTIRYDYTFSPIDTNKDRFYGMSVSGNFFRPPFDLASGDQLTLQSSVTYEKSNGTLLPEKIGGTIGTGETLEYGVPESGSVSLNDFTPQNPSQVIEKINCKLIGGGGSCLQQEKIEVILTVKLSPGDSIILAGSVHVPGTRSTDELTNILYSMTGTIDIKPGESANFVGPGDQGELWVALLGGGTDTPLCTPSGKRGKATICITIPAFNVFDVNIDSVYFGPSCSSGPCDPLDPTCGCKAKVTQYSFQDVNNDGNKDLRVRFNNSDIGWISDCSNGKTGTLIGTLNVPPSLPPPAPPQGFSATGGIQCQPAK